MDIRDRTVIKEYEYAQVSLITDFNGKRFIEKTQFHKPPVIPLTFQYDLTELEIYKSILKPLEIPCAQIIDSNQNEKYATFIIDFIDGIECENEPKAEYLYTAAEKIGTIYSNSKINIHHLNENIVKKYSINKKVIFEYIKIINKHYSIPSIDSLIEYIFTKYQNKTFFVNHGDVQFKNFIYNDDLHFIDWECARISPFFSDLEALISQANVVNADINEIKKRYLKFSQLNSITDEDIYIGGIISSIKAVFELLIFDCPVEWIEDSYNGLLNLINKIKMN